MIPGHLLLAQRIRDELTELERSVNRVGRAWEAAKQAQAEQDMFVDAVVGRLGATESGIGSICHFSRRR